MELSIKHYNELSADELYEIFKLRVDVFIVEQNNPCREIDEIDRDCYHLCAREDGELKAYLRIITKADNTVVFGRVISIKRRCGLGTRILSEAIEFSKAKFKPEKLTLEAQTYAKGLYEKVGFRQSSDVFQLDGLPHIKMELIPEYK